MKKLLLASVASVAIIAAANAADKARPVYKAAPAVAPIPAFSWTGCYLGGHGGWGWGREHITQKSVNSAGIVRARTSGLDTEGAIFGGQIGCDYQFASNFVLGLRGDFAGTRLTGSVQDPMDPTDKADVLRVETRWISSVTGRLGFNGFDPKLLVYAKGGGAWANDQYDFRSIDLFAVRGIYSVTWSGWTIGGGLEYAIAPNWSLFAEFNFYDLRGSKTLASVSGTGACFVLSARPCSQTIQVGGPTIDAVTVGVNYRFGGPVVARH